MTSRPTGREWFVVRVGAARPGPPVLHIAVPKRAYPLATRRNRIKRLVREAVRRQIRLCDGVQYRVWAQRVPERATLDQVVAELRKAFQQ